MTYLNLKLSLLLSFGLLLTACNDKQSEAERKQDSTGENVALPVVVSEPNDEAPQAPVAEEPTDQTGTQVLNGKLLGVLEGISREQTMIQEDSSQKSLEELSEADRRALIDMTIESSSKKVGEDANELLENLEPID